MMYLLTRQDRQPRRKWLVSRIFSFPIARSRSPFPSLCYPGWHDTCREPEHLDLAEVLPSIITGGPFAALLGSVVSLLHAGADLSQQ